MAETAEHYISREQWKQLCELHQDLGILKNQMNDARDNYKEIKKAVDGKQQELESYIKEVREPGLFSNEDIREADEIEDDEEIDDAE